MLQNFELSGLLGLLSVVSQTMSNNLATASIVGLSTIVMDLWALAALRALKQTKNSEVVRQAADNFDTFLNVVRNILIVLGAAIIFALGLGFLRGLGTPQDPKIDAELSGGVAITSLAVMLFAIPKLTRLLQGKLEGLPDFKVSRLSLKGATAALLKFDPANPGPLTNIFYIKVIVVDSIYCALVVAKLSVALLGLLGFTLPTT